MALIKTLMGVMMMINFAHAQYYLAASKITSFLQVLWISTQSLPGVVMTLIMPSVSMKMKVNFAYMQYCKGIYTYVIVIL